MNKRGGEKLLSLWWFFVLVVIATGIVIGVLIYARIPENVNELESDILANKIINCITEGSYLKNEFLNNFDIFKECGLNQNLFNSEEDFYFKIIFSGEDGKKLKEISAGNNEFEADCKIKAKVKAEHYPSCVEKDFFVYLKGGIGKAKINIIAGSNQGGEKLLI